MQIASVGIRQITQPTFKGVWQQISQNANEEELKKNSLWHSNSSADRTLGSYHMDVKRQAYYAAPMEFINDSIKENADFVVYDNEPYYPQFKELEQNYLGHNRKNLREDIENVREYHYRREMGGHANVEEAKYQQWQAAECTALYDKAGDARYRKELIEDEMDIISKNIATKEKQIIAKKAELQAKEALQISIKKTISELVKKSYAYNKINTCIENAQIRDEQEDKFVQYQRKYISEQLEQEKAKLRNNAADIKQIKKLLEELPQRIEGLGQEAAKKSELRERIISCELKPMLETMKQFYLKQLKVMIK